jgi:Arc/MetJ family transcription regulator
VITTIEIDDGLLAKAAGLTGPTDASVLIHAALTALVERESARRLARLGGSEPGVVQARRRRT